MNTSLATPSVCRGADALRTSHAPVTLRAAIVDKLRAAIVRGELPPGSLLREVALAQRLGVSATPVREAMGQLAAEGLVEIEPNRLRRVAPIDAKSIADLLEVQSALWRMAYVRAFPHLDVYDLETLRKAVAIMEKAVSGGAAGQAHAGMDLFNSVLLQRAGSPEIVRLTKDRRALLTRHLRLVQDQLIDRQWVAGHEAMVAAIDDGALSDFLAQSDVMATRLLTVVAERHGSAQRPIG